MTIKYDTKSDASYVRITNNKVFKTREISDGFLVDYDSNKNIVGIEILDVKKRKVVILFEMALTKSPLQILSEGKEVALPPLSSSDKRQLVGVSR